MKTENIDTMSPADTKQQIGKTAKDDNHKAITPDDEKSRSVQYIHLNFKPETLSKHNNLKFLLFQLGYNYHKEKTYVSKYEV